MVWYLCIRTAFSYYLYNYTRTIAKHWSNINKCGILKKSQNSKKIFRIKKIKEIKVWQFKKKNIKKTILT